MSYESLSGPWPRGREPRHRAAPPVVVTLQPGQTSYQRFERAAPELSGLAFSLKPPKWLKKLTLKKVIKPLAIGAGVIVGAAFIPGALPLLAKGAGWAAKGVIGAGKLVGRGAAAAERVVAKQVEKAGSSFLEPFAKKAIPTPGPDTSPGPMSPRETGPSGTLGPTAAVPWSAPTFSFSTDVTTKPSGGAGVPYGPQTAEEAGAATTPTPANLTPLILAGVGLAGLVLVSKSRRGRS